MLEKLAADWLAAKADEAAANARRVGIEEQIVALTGKRDEGSQTHKPPGFTVTVTGKVSRKMDWAKWDLVKSQIATPLWPVRTKFELDEKGVKWLQQNEVEIYTLLPITVTPAKTAIEVKAIEA